VVTAASRLPVRPYALQAAVTHGGPSEGPYVLVLGYGDPLTRATFLAAPRSFDDGAVAVKVSRLTGPSTAFDRDERGLALAAAVGASHVPRLLGRFDIDGAPGSVESAGAGEQLGRLLRRTPRGSQTQLITSVVDWTTELSLASAQPAPTDGGHLTGLAGLPGMAAALTAVATVPTVLTHADLGSWNIVTAGGDFTVLDWESAEEHGLPLADLLYFATDALGLSAGADTQQDRFEHAVALHTGRVPESALLYGWLTAAASRLGIGRERVGALALLCWADHGTSRAARLARLADPAAAAEEPYAGRLAEVWREDQLLGAGWPAFSQS
jgi:hypothetical protein